MNTYEQDAAEYSAEHDAAADTWILANANDYATIVDEQMRTYHAELGGFRRRMDAVTRLAAQASGFPTFSAWLTSRYPSTERVA